MSIASAHDARATAQYEGENMPKVVVTAQVEDAAKWEEGFRTHGDLFRSETVTTSISFTTNEANEVAVFFEPANLETFMKGMDSQATADAMAADGVKRETVKDYVLDKEFQP